MNFNQVIIARSTYGLLDLLGDIGGLFDALWILINMFLMPYTSFMQRTFVLKRLFRLKPRAPSSFHESKLSKGTTDTT